MYRHCGKHEIFLSFSCLNSAVWGPLAGLVGGHVMPSCTLVGGHVMPSCTLVGGHVMPDCGWISIIQFFVRNMFSQTSKSCGVWHHNHFIIDYRSQNVPFFSTANISPFGLLWYYINDYNIICPINQSKSIKACLHTGSLGIFDSSTCIFLHGCKTWSIVEQYCGCCVGILTTITWWRNIHTTDKPVIKLLCIRLCVLMMQSPNRLT